MRSATSDSKRPPPRVQRHTKEAVDKGNGKGRNTGAILNIIVIHPTASPLLRGGGKRRGKEEGRKERKKKRRRKKKERSPSLTHLYHSTVGPTVPRCQSECASTLRHATGAKSKSSRLMASTIHATAKPGHAAQPRRVWR